MSKHKWNLNNIYISERLQESLRPISHSALTAIVAPMGYGKTTAINWYLEEKAKTEELHIIRISVYSDNIVILWKSIQDAFKREGFDFLMDYACPNDAASIGLVADDISHELSGDKSCYIFIDDFHLLRDKQATLLLCMVVNRLPSNVHMIVASRDRFLDATEIVRLGNRIYQIGIEQLRLNHTELAIYSRRCGIVLSDKQVEKILYSSEGWFSAVYLSLMAYFENGILPDNNSDIYSTFTAAMINPLPQKQQEFLAVMGLSDEFTIEMAEFVTEDDDANAIITSLSEHNAFVKRLSDGVTYRFHHMMKECAKRSFVKLDIEKQLFYLNRLGLWYENHGQYLHAIKMNRESRNYDALLRVIEKDAGILLSSLNPETVLKDINECPDNILKEHPSALLVLMRRMFTWRQVPKMMELKQLLLDSISENDRLTEEERGNLLGECDLILSFLYYNDISAMSRLHRSAGRQMSRRAISIQSNGGWTFGSPSVLMMFYRGFGELESELQEMDECMPHYYKVTGNHGQGAEIIMRAEALYNKGRFTDAEIEVEKAYACISGNNQENMALCCDFLSRRLSLYTDIKERYSFEERRSELLKYHNAEWINIWSATSAYYHALLGNMEMIPAVFAMHQLSDINFLAPCKSMMDMIENQVYLAEGAYTKIIGRSAGLMSLCEVMHYALVGLHIRIQTAIAYDRLGKYTEAHNWFLEALKDGECDDLIMPFVENYDYLKDMLKKEIMNDFIERIIKTAEDNLKRKTEEKCQRVFDALTKREYEIVMMMKDRLSNREIAERLCLSEGSVKQYINQIYAKLQIEGDTRTKRRKLSLVFLENT